MQWSYMHPIARIDWNDNADDAIHVCAYLRLLERSSWTTRQRRGRDEVAVRLQ